MTFNLLVCLGLVWVLRYGSILNLPRNLLTSIHPKINELFNCSLCLGFWAGLIIGYVNYKLNGMNPLHIIYLGFASSAVCWFFDSLLDLIQLGSNKLDN